MTFQHVLACRLNVNEFGHALVFKEKRTKRKNDTKRLVSQDATHGVARHMAANEQPPQVVNNVCDNFFHISTASVV